GHGKRKETQLWLQNLPRLEPTRIVDGRSPAMHYMAPGPDRWKDRNRTYIGIAEAMAEKSGRYVMRELAEPPAVSFQPQQQDL
ncbi:hypothetical protein ACV35P_31405, partial [Pseudomonas aeruginosa]